MRGTARVMLCYVMLCYFMLCPRNGRAEGLCGPPVANSGCLRRVTVQSSPRFGTISSTRLNTDNSQACPRRSHSSAPATGAPPSPPRDRQGRPRERHVRQEILLSTRNLSPPLEPNPRNTMPLCQRAWLLAVLLVALLTWHIRPRSGPVVIVETQPARGGAVQLPEALRQQQPPPQPAVREARAPDRVDAPGWVGDHEPRTRSLLRRVQLAAAAQRPQAVPGVDGLGGCPGNCSGHGQCQAQRGITGRWATRCACAPGWNGTACEVRDASPCNTPQGGRVLSRCAGHCDEDVNRCYCGAGSRFPSRPMPWCYYDGVERDMPWQTPAWSGFAHGPRAHFWGGGSGAAKPGGSLAWCDAEPGQFTRVRCKCYDGQNANRLCEPIAPASSEATFCLNQCSGRGECRSGYCRCAASHASAPPLPPLPSSSSSSQQHHKPPPPPPPACPLSNQVRARQLRSRLLAAAARGGGRPRGGGAARRARRAGGGRRGGREGRAAAAARVRVRAAGRVQHLPARAPAERGRVRAARVRSIPPHRHLTTT